MVDGGAHFGDDAGKLMSEHGSVFEARCKSTKRKEIGSADRRELHSYHGIGRPTYHGLRDVLQAHVLDSGQNDSFHPSSSISTR
jgi:hypothetical protein